MNPIFKNKDEIKSRIEKLEELMIIRFEKLYELYEKKQSNSDDAYFEKVAFSEKIVKILKLQSNRLRYSFKNFKKKLPKSVIRHIAPNELVEHHRIFGFFTSLKFEYKKTLCYYDFKEKKLKTDNDDKQALEFCEKINKEITHEVEELNKIKREKPKTKKQKCKEFLNKLKEVDGIKWCPYIESSNIEDLKENYPSSRKKYESVYYTTLYKFNWIKLTRFENIQFSDLLTYLINLLKIHSDELTVEDFLDNYYKKQPKKLITDVSDTQPI